MAPKLEVFSQGEEILSGQICDTNAMWLSQQARQMGFEVTRHTAVGDNLDNLVNLLKEISSRADCCICTGGLGPTQDDLTTQAVSEAFSLPLVFDPIAYQQIELFFTSRQRRMPEVNSKQAMLPSGSGRVDNTLGTAPGFTLQFQRCWFVFLPGVPKEMHPMFSQLIKPILSKKFDLKPKTLVTIKSFGLGESEIQERIKQIIIPPSVQLGFRANSGDVETKLLFPHLFPIQERSQLINSIVNLLDDHFLAHSENNECKDLVACVDELMTQQNLTLAIIETISGGLFAAMCQNANWLVAMAYHRSLRNLEQRISRKNHTTDPESITLDIAKLFQKETNADIVMVQNNKAYMDTSTGYNDRTELTISLLTTNFQKTKTVQVFGNIERKQHYAAMISFDLLRKYLTRNL